MTENELKHYGVIGMRWGIRRAAKKGTTYNYRSHGQKKWQKKYDKQVAKNKKPMKIEKTEIKLNKFKKRDINRVNYAKTTTVGRSVAKGLLFGPAGAGTYARMRSGGHGRLYSAMAGNVITSSFGYPVALIVSRDHEFRYRP